MQVRDWLTENGLLVSDGAGTVRARHRLAFKSLHERLTGKVHCRFAREEAASICRARAKAARRLQGSARGGRQIAVASESVKTTCGRRSAGVVRKSGHGHRTENCGEKSERFHVVPFAFEL